MDDCGCSIDGRGHKDRYEVVNKQILEACEG